MKQSEFEISYSVENYDKKTVGISMLMINA